jgi:hypothetical protein
MVVVLILLFVLIECFFVVKLTILQAVSVEVLVEVVEKVVEEVVVEVVEKVTYVSRICMQMPLALQTSPDFSNNCFCNITSDDIR